jgi:hypothetical protein
MLQLTSRSFCMLWLLISLVQFYAMANYNPLYAMILPNHVATLMDLVTFNLPQQVSDTPADLTIVKSIIDTLCKMGIFQIQLSFLQSMTLSLAFNAVKLFF